MKEFEVIVSKGGGVRFLYDDDLFVAMKALGRARRRRASHVEPQEDSDDLWQADMSPVGGPVLSGFGSRAEALEAERAWLLGRDVPVPA